MKVKCSICQKGFERQRFQTLCPACRTAHDTAMRGKWVAMKKERQKEDLVERESARYDAEIADLRARRLSLRQMQDALSSRLTRLTQLRAQAGV